MGCGCLDVSYSCAFQSEIRSQKRLDQNCFCTRRCLGGGWNKDLRSCLWNQPVKGGYGCGVRS